MVHPVCVIWFGFCFFDTACTGQVIAIRVIDISTFVILPLLHLLAGCLLCGVLLVSAFLHLTDTQLCDIAR